MVTLLSWVIFALELRKESRTQKQQHMSIVGKKFPNLSVNAMNDLGDTFKLNVLEEAQKNNKKVLLFWYPKDFTFVCPTELHAFQAAAAEFEKRNT